MLWTYRKWRSTRPSRRDSPSVRRMSLKRQHTTPLHTETSWTHTTDTLKFTPARIIQEAQLSLG